ncbi:hypothetical protein ACWIWK_00145 [Helicobacter sp. 23-1048]
MKTIITLMCLCVMVACSADSVDIADSKGRTFWDKKFIRYPAEGTYSSAQITKTCNTKEYFDEVGLQTNSKDKTIKENFPMEQGEAIEIKSVVLQNNKFLLRIGDLQTATWSVEFLDDTHIESCSQYDNSTFCHKYVLCP